MVAMTIDRTVDPQEVESERFDDVQPQVASSEDRTWERFAACAGMPEATQLFFSDDLHDVSQAKLICSGCPVMANCLEGALDRHEQWGVWGGQLFANGKVVLNKRRRGRPPKHVRPEDQLPVIPFPAHLQDRLRIA